jgi:hypothetical protein
MLLWRSFAIEATLRVRSMEWSAFEFRRIVSGSDRTRDKGRALGVSNLERTEHALSPHPNKLNGIGKVWLPEQDSNLRPFD